MFAIYNFESNGLVLDDQKIMIVAHSAGGIVTRTAMLLSNHPKSCLVSNIILLSSPNKRYLWFLLRNASVV